MGSLRIWPVLVATGQVRCRVEDLTDEFCGLMGGLRERKPFGPVARSVEIACHGRCATMDTVQSAARVLAGQGGRSLF